MKVLLLPNEYDANDTELQQIGSRKAFRRLVAEGEIARLEIFSFLHEEILRGANAAKEKLLEIAHEMAPDIIFWQHIKNFPVDLAFMEQLRRRSGKTFLVYHDDDPFDRWVKRPTRSMATILAASDLVFISGFGDLCDQFRKLGASVVRYMPSCYDDVRFGSEWMPPQTRAVALTMIATNGRRRIPGLYIPGGRRRARLARTLSRRFQKDFALYGSGWDGNMSAKGRLPYSKQGVVLRDSWISVNWDHFDDIPFYFSDRLPISLAAGVVHVTTYHAGYEYILGSCPGLYWARSVEEMLPLIEWLLSRPKQDLIDEGLAAQRWAQKNLEADVVFRRGFEMCKQLLDSRKVR
jgi:hypothetical protein